MKQQDFAEAYDGRVIQALATGGALTYVLPIHQPEEVLGEGRACAGFMDGVKVQRTAAAAPSCRVFFEAVVQGVPNHFDGS